jgi:catechol 2,3-dioxygenase-like lactoylglutathione lyase family enzyme
VDEVRVRGIDVKRHIFKAALAASAFALPVCALAGWTKTYVVEWNEPAMYYGAKTGVIDPGTDCPKGTNPEIDWVKVLVDAGYTLEEAKWLRNPANPTRSPVHGQNQMAFRGKDRANVYIIRKGEIKPGATEFGNIVIVVPNGRKMAERVAAAGYPPAKIVDGTNFVKDPDGYTIEFYQRPAARTAQ